jgi:tRNA acetyltransferase TAN1
MTDLLVSYSWGRFDRARSEILRILTKFGDSDPSVERTAVRGIAIAHTALDNREVIRQCWRLWQSERPDSFEFAVKWVPVDFWCETDLAAMKQIIDTRIEGRLEQGQTWGMKVRKRGWQRYHSCEIVEFLAAGIDAKVDLSNPDWILWVDVIGRRTAISLLRPQVIFSLGLPHL